MLAKDKIDIDELSRAVSKLKNTWDNGLRELFLLNASDAIALDRIDGGVSNDIVFGNPSAANNFFEAFDTIMPNLIASLNSATAFEERLGSTPEIIAKTIENALTTLQEMANANRDAYNGDIIKVTSLRRLETEYTQLLTAHEALEKMAGALGVTLREKVLENKPEPPTRQRT